MIEGADPPGSRFPCRVERTPSRVAADRVPAHSERGDPRCVEGGCSVPYAARASSLRGTEGVQLQLPLSNWHRSILGDQSWELGSLTVTPGKIIVVVRQDAPLPFEPRRAIALDTNEDSLDGVIAEGASAVLVTIHLDGVRQVQATHFR